MFKLKGLLGFLLENFIFRNVAMFAFPPTVASVTSSVANYPSVYYDRKGVIEFTSNLHLYQALETDHPMPEKAGVAMQLYGFNKLAANTTAATDGTPQSAGVALTASTNTLTLSQYIDYVTYSDKLILTGISPIVAEGSRLLGYRGALTVDTVISAAVDTVTGTDTATKIDVAHSSFMTTAIARKAVGQLRSLDVKPKANGKFFGVISSLLAFDFRNDSNAGGFQDWMRYANPSNIQSGTNTSSDLVATVEGADWFESNSLPVVANFASTGVNGYRAYLFGRDAFVGASLLKGVGEMGNGFSVMTKTYDGTNSLDPAGQIRAASVYNFLFGLQKRPQAGATGDAFRRITSESSIG
jgi:N4-gp56 family major capsid protein